MNDTAGPTFSDCERNEIKALDEALLRRFLDPLCYGENGKPPIRCGLHPASCDGRRAQSEIPCRHHAHGDGNAAAVAFVKRQMSQILGDANVVATTAEGRHENVIGELRGTGDDGALVIVGAHIDSVSHSHHAPAPGADDDASGVAAVLAIAQIHQRLAKKCPPKRTLRYAIFNLEEAYLVGSMAYADQLRASQAKVAAMLQMDMIGWCDSGDTPKFEIHANDEGSAGARLAAFVARCSPTFAFAKAQYAAQVHAHETRGYLGPVSDHLAFIAHGWPACLVCEDLFPCERSKKHRHGNPNYHTSRDTAVCFGYAAALARTVAAASWRIAQGDEL